MAKKIRKKTTKKNKLAKIEIDQILLNSRQLFLFEEINSESASKLVKQLLALDRIANSPIALYINSPGGTVASGFAIIDTIQGVNSQVVTFVTGSANSMAGLIAMSGVKRIMSRTARIMLHDLWAGSVGNTNTMVDRAEFLESYQKQLFDFIRKNSKLSEKDLEKARHGELWLTAEESLKKGVIDRIV